MRIYQRSAGTRFSFGLLAQQSLKGFQLSAQGNALGNNALLSLRPERAKARYTILCPFRA